MKILFVIKDVEYIDPMGLMLLSALAKERGHETKANVLADGNLTATVKEYNPDIVAFSAKTGEHKYYMAAGDLVKKIDESIFTIMGGPHPTFFPEIIEGHDFDALCVGEGDAAWVELLDALDNGEPIDSIDNIVTKKNFNPGEAPRIRAKRTDLDSLPFLDRDLFYKTTRLGRFPMRSFMISRGCPFKCTYCFNHKYNEIYKGKGPVVSRMSVDRIIAELKDLVSRYETQYIKFYDDVFVFKSDDWLEEFSEKYHKEIGLPFHCLIRADLLNEEIMTKLKLAGLQSVSMSIESGNARIRDDVLKRGMTEDQMIAAFDLCTKYGIPTFSNTILAIPSTGLAEDIESLDMNLRCKVTFGEFPIFYPYPGTELAQFAIDSGAFDGDYNKLHMSYQTTSPLKGWTDEEKRQQLNLSMLGTMCLLLPSTRNLVVNRLIKLPFTGLYFLIYYFTKLYLIKTKIYPMSFSPINAVRTLYDSFVLEKFKHYEEVSTEGDGGGSGEVSTGKGKLS